MLKEKYELYKLTYKEYLVLLKSGNFFIALNNDAIVMNNVFKYKIIRSKNFIKSGFPLGSLDKVIDRLKIENINYVLIDNELNSKEKFKNNNYSKFVTKIDNYEIILNRINMINNILKKNLANPNIKNILNEMEDILCKINY